MKTLFTIFNVIAVVLMVSVAALFVVPLLPFENNIELRIVESGSMEPAIMTGAVVLIVPQSEYAVGDVITFGNSSARVPTTHRIVDTYQENGQSWFITKGDANEEADTAAVAREDVVGTVFFDVPYAGYVLDFSRQPLGFFFLIILPALMIIFGEIEKIWSELRQKNHSRKGTRSTPHSNELDVAAAEAQLIVAKPHVRMIDIATPVRYRDTPTLDLRHSSPYETTPAIKTKRPITEKVHPWAALGVSVLFAAVIIGANFLPTTISYPNDIEASLGNRLGAITLDFNAVSDGGVYSFVDGVLSGDDDGALVTVVAPEAGSVEVRHTLSVEVTGGSVLFCEAINASTDSPFSYDGPLPALSASDVTFTAPWSLSLTLPNDAGLTDDDTCDVDIVYIGWHYDVATDQGYFDEERTPLSFIFVAAQPTFQAASIAPLSLEVNNEELEEEVVGSTEEVPPEPEVTEEPGDEVGTEPVTSEEKTESAPSEEVDEIVKEVVEEETDPVATEEELEPAPPEEPEVIVEDEVMEKPEEVAETEPEITEEFEEEEEEIVGAPESPTTEEPEELEPEEPESDE